MAEEPQVKHRYRIDGKEVEWTQEEFEDYFWGEKYAARLAGDVFKGDTYGRCIDHTGQVWAFAFQEARDPKGKDTRFWGFGGSTFVFRFTSGAHVGQTHVSNSVWSCGEVPDRWQERLPVTAEVLECDCGRHWEFGRGKFVDNPDSILFRPTKDEPCEKCSIVRDQSRERLRTDL